MASSTVKTRICIISDTHTATPFSIDDRNHAFREPLPEADILLHAGDLTNTGRLSEHQKTMKMIRSAPAELKIVIPGNHDISLDPAYYDAVGCKRFHHGRSEDLAAIRELYCGADAQANGVAYMEEGVRTFTLKNGARFTVYASAYQPAFCGWAFAYERSQDRYNPASAECKFRAPNPVPSYPDVDIMLTHGPPYGILDETYRAESVGCENLRRAVKRCKPRLHCFGHIHEGWGAMRVKWTGGETGDELAKRLPQDMKKIRQERAAFVDVSRESSADPLKAGEETLFVNASIMNVSYNPANAPHVIDLDLPIGMYHDYVFTLERNEMPWFWMQSIPFATE